MRNEQHEHRRLPHRKASAPLCEIANPIMKQWPYRTALWAFLVLFCANTFGQELSIDSTIMHDCRMNGSQPVRFFNRLETISQFKDLSKGWFDFAQKNMDFNSIIKLLPDSVELFQDSITVRFIVTIKGEICGVHYISGNKLLFPAVAQLLYASPKWMAATNGGILVSAYRNLQLDLFIDKRIQEAKVVRKFPSYFYMKM